MARTYWKKHQDNSWEFLGAYRDGHVVKDQKSPQAAGAILDIPDLDIEGVHTAFRMDSRENPPMLVGLPSAQAKRMQLKILVSLPWVQLQGFVK